MIRKVSSNTAPVQDVRTPAHHHLKRVWSQLRTSLDARHADVSVSNSKKMKTNNYRWTRSPSDRTCQRRTISAVSAIDFECGWRGYHLSH